MENHVVNDDNDANDAEDTDTERDEDQETSDSESDYEDEDNDLDEGDASSSDSGLEPDALPPATRYEENYGIISLTHRGSQAFFRQGMLLYSNDDGRRCLPGEPAELQWRAEKLMVVDWLRDRGLADLKRFWARKKLYPKRGIDIVQVMEPDGIIKRCLAMQRQIMENFISFYSREIAAPYVINQVKTLLPPPREVQKFPPEFWRPSQQEMREAVAADREYFSDDADHENSKVDDKAKSKNDLHPEMPKSSQGEVTHKGNSILSLFTCAVALGSMKLKTLRMHSDCRVTGIIVVINFFTTLIMRLIRVTTKPRRLVKRRTRAIGKRTTALLILSLNILSIISVIDLGREFHLHQASVSNLRFAMLACSGVSLILLCGGRESNRAGEILLTAITLVGIGETTVRTFHQVSTNLVCGENLSHCGILKVLFLSATTGIPVANVVAGVDDFRGHDSIINTVPVAVSMSTATLFLSHTFIESLAKREKEAIEHDQVDGENEDFDDINKDGEDWVEQHQARLVPPDERLVESFFNAVDDPWGVNTAETQNNRDEGVSDQETDEADIASLADQSEAGKSTSETLKVKEEVSKDDQDHEEGGVEIRSEERRTSNYLLFVVVEGSEGTSRKQDDDEEEIIDGGVDETEIADLAGPEDVEENTSGLTEGNRELPESVYEVEESSMKRTNEKRKNRICSPVRIYMIPKQFHRCHLESRHQVDEGTVESWPFVKVTLNSINRWSPNWRRVEMRIDTWCSPTCKLTRTPGGHLGPSQLLMTMMTLRVANRVESLGIQVGGHHNSLTRHRNNYYENHPGIMPAVITRGESSSVENNPLHGRKTYLGGSDYCLGMYKLGDRFGELEAPCRDYPSRHGLTCHLYKLSCACHWLDETCCQGVYDNMVAPDHAVDKMKMLLMKNGYNVPFTICMFTLVTQTPTGSYTARNPNKLTETEKERNKQLELAAERIEQEYRRAYQTLVASPKNSVTKKYAKRICLMGTPSGETCIRLLEHFGVRQLVPTSEWYLLVQKVKKEVETFEIKE